MTSAVDCVASYIASAFSFCSPVYIIHSFLPVQDFVRRALSTETVKQTDVANKLQVSKVSTYNAMKRLREKGFIEKNERKIVLTERGKEGLNEYITIIRFISAHLSLHCGTEKIQAYEDALNATCAFSDATRNGVANFIRSGVAGAHPVPIDSNREQANDR